MDRKTNMQRSLARNKKQVQAMNLENKKNQTKINQLTEKLNEMNKEFIKEKKATNTILESSRIESAEVLATAKSLIHESRLLKRAAEEIKTKEKVDMLKIARKERIIYSKKLKLAKEAMVREKEEKKHLMGNIRLMEDNTNTLTDELLTLKKTLSAEAENRKELQKQTESERKKFLNERGKRYDANRNAQNKLKDKQEEIMQLTETLFEVSDEMSGMKKEKIHALNEKKKMEIALQKNNVKVNTLLKKNGELRDRIEVEKKNIDIKEVKKTNEGGQSGHTWPLWMLQVILESLANGTPPIFYTR